MTAPTGPILVAGASGVVGRRLVPLLRGRGYDVAGTTRSRARAVEVERLGATPVVVDVLDPDALARAVAAVAPRVIIHQLTDLSGGFGRDQIGETLARNARLRADGTRNLAAAARAAGVRRIVAQSIAWVYAPGPEPHTEDDAIDLATGGTRAVTIQGVVALERAVLATPPVEGIVLRYGWFYGPGTRETPADSPGVHVDAAALAAALAIDRGAPGIYNVADASPRIAIEKARRELGWDPAFRQS